MLLNNNCTFSFMYYVTGFLFVVFFVATLILILTILYLFLPSTIFPEMGFCSSDKVIDPDVCEDKPNVWAIRAEADCGDVETASICLINNTPQYQKFPNFIHVEFENISNLVVDRPTESGFTMQLNDVSSKLDIEFSADGKKGWHVDGLYPFQKLKLASVSWSELSSIETAQYSYLLGCDFSAIAVYRPCPSCYSTVPETITNFNARCQDVNATFNDMGAFGLCMYESCSMAVLD